MHASSIDSRRPPWTLCRVSSRWRREGLSYPRMWSFIRLWCHEVVEARTVVTRSRRHDTFTEVLEHVTTIPSPAKLMLAAQIRRSGNHPLSIAIYSNAILTDTHPYISMLASCSERWAVLDLRLSRHSAYRAFVCIDGCTPNLHTLHMMANLSDPIMEPIKLFTVASSLRCIYATFSGQRTYLFPNEQISDLTLSGMVTSHTNVLAGLLALRTCCLHAPPPTRYHAAPIIPFMHTSLRELSVLPIASRTGVPCGSIWLQYFTLPALRSLELRGTPDLAIMRAFTERSNCHLVTLSIERTTRRSYLFPGIVPLEGFVEFLDVVPELQSLKLTGNDSESTTFIELVSSLTQLQDDGTPKRLTRLVELSLGGDGLGGELSAFLKELHQENLRPNLAILMNGRVI